LIGPAAARDTMARTLRVVMKLNMMG
jgi:hypothetical protein